MDNMPNILAIRDRRYEEIPIDQVKVINSRNRDKEQFEMNVESIDSVGLLKPIRVNDKFVERTGMYELICGEGRLLAQLRHRAEILHEEFNGDEVRLRLRLEASAADRLRLERFAAAAV